MISSYLYTSKYRPGMNYTCFVVCWVVSFHITKIHDTHFIIYRVNHRIFTPLLFSFCSHTKSDFWNITRLNFELEKIFNLKMIDRFILYYWFLEHITHKLQTSIVLTWYIILHEYTTLCIYISIRCNEYPIRYSTYNTGLTKI